jgi:hypothetical protein
MGGVFAAAMRNRGIMTCDQTGHADLPHPALGQDVTLSPTEGRGFFSAN